MEWLLTPDGRWDPVDPVREMAHLAALARQDSARNRERILRSRTICEHVRRNLRQGRAWRTLRVDSRIH